MPTTRRSRRNGGVAIELSDIKYDSDCMTLHLPRDLCCDICVKKFDASIGMQRKSSCKKKSFRHLSQSSRCQQLWLSKHGADRSHTSTVQRHVKVRNYLNIALDVDLCYVSVYNKESRPSDPPSGHGQSSAAYTQLTVPTPVTPQASQSLPQPPAPQASQSLPQSTRVTPAPSPLSLPQSTRVTPAPSPLSLPQPPAPQFKPISSPSPLSHQPPTTMPVPRPPPQDLDSYLQTRYPRKYDASQSTWTSCDFNTTWRTKQEVNDLSKYLQVVSGNNAAYCAHLLHSVLRNNEEVQRCFEETSVSESDKIVKGINTFVKERLKASGCKRKEEKEAMNLLLTACTKEMDDSMNKNRVRELIGMSNQFFYENYNNTEEPGPYQHRRRKVAKSLC